MWTLFVVLRLPERNLPACVQQIGKPAHLQALFAQPAVEALYMRVLRRFARLDVAQIDLPLQRPCQEMPTRQLRPVVTANRLRAAASGDDLIQRPCHTPAGKAGIHFQHQALARERIDHAQHADVPSGDHVVNEVERPLLVGSRQRGPRRAHTHAVPALLPLQAQPRLAIDPPHSLVIHSLAFPFH